MTRRYWPLITLLGAAWGASYLFIKVAVDGGLSPSALIFARCTIAGAALLAYLCWKNGTGVALVQVKGAWRPALVLGAINSAVPYWLVAWGETHIDSGVAAIAQATVPIFSLLVGLRFLQQERIGPMRVAGICVGLAGVGLVAGLAPDGDSKAVIGTLAVVLASFFYASAGIYGQLRLKATSGPVLATASLIAAAVLLLPFAVVQRPESMPTTGALASLVALALAGTGVAQLLLYHTLELFGARKVSLVTYLMPGFALVYGVVLLDESITLAAILGLAVILFGVALGSGSVRLGRRRPAAGGAPG